MTKLTVEGIIPGGIQPSDHVHRGTNDNTCSRCRNLIGDDEVPLMLWFNGDRDMLIYCETCVGDDAWAAQAPIVPA